MTFLDQTFAEFLITVIRITENKLLHLSTLHPTVAIVANISDLFSLFLCLGAGKCRSDQGLMLLWQRTQVLLPPSRSGSSGPLEVQLQRDLMPLSS